MKQRIILAAVAVLVVIMFFWLLTHSVISLNVDNPAGGETITYSLTDNAGVITTIKSDKPTVRKIVKRGSYQILATQGNTNQFKFVTTKRFLRSSNVAMTLETESGRRFAGDNPAPCMYYLGARLLSEECEDDIGAIQEHVPATADLPTYTTDISANELYGTNKGIAITRSGAAIILLQGVEGEVGHYVQQINPDLAGGPRYEVPVADQDASYTIHAYQDGVLVYDNDFREAFYLSSVNAEPTPLSIEGPNNSNLHLLNTRVQQDTITQLYSSGEADDSTFNPEDKSQQAKQQSGDSEVIVYQNNEERHFSFKTVFSYAAVCGTDKLCLIDQTGLSVYDISSDKKPVYLYKISHVSGLEETSAGLLAITDSGLLAIDVDERQGYLSYSFGGYDFYGLQPAARGYLVCLINSRSNKVALYVDESIKDTDSIDKKVLALQKTKEINTISAYGQFIYLVPDYGEQIYDATENINTNDPAKVKKVDAVIDSAIAASGIDQHVYTIINSGQIQ